jgi:outer membrane protein
LKNKNQQNRQKRRLILPGSALLFCLLIGPRLEAANQTFTLDQAVSYAETHNPDIAIARKKVEAAKGGLLEARSGYLPSVISTGLLREREHQTDSRLRNEDYSASVKVVQNVYTGGEVPSQMAIARLKLEQQELELQALSNRVLMDVRVAFNELLVNRSKVRVQEQSVGVLQEELKTQQQRFAAGLVGELNVRRAEVALAKQKTAWIDAQTELSNSYLSLGALLGTTADARTATPTFEASGELIYHPQHAELAECLARADVDRPEIRAREIEIQIEDEQEKLDRSEMRPHVEAFSGYELYNERDPQVGPEFNHGYVVGVNARWHIFDGYATKGKLIATRARREAAMQALAAMRSTVSSEVRSAFLDLQQADRVLESETKSVQTADESLEIAKANVSAGLATQLDTLQAAADVTRTRTTRLNGIFLHNSALARLARACATTPEMLAFWPKGKNANPSSGPAAADMAHPPGKLSQR